MCWLLGTQLHQKRNWVQVAVGDGVGFGVGFDVGFDVGEGGADEGEAVPGWVLVPPGPGVVGGGWAAAGLEAPELADAPAEPDAEGEGEGEEELG